MATLQLPIRNDQPAYRFQLTLETRVYFFEFRFNTRQDRWLMDVLDETQSPILMGIPILTGLPILDGYTRATRPPGTFVAVDLTGQERNADRETFGVDVVLLYVESES
jgi:hypothetical protein